MASEQVQTFTDDNFKAEVIEADVPVLVDFWAEWCAPCRALTPTIDELATTYDGKVKIGKLDIDSNQSAATDFKITAIPTILLFKGGEVHKKFVGMTTKGDLEDALNEIAG